MLAQKLYMTNILKLQIHGFMSKWRVEQVHKYAPYMTI